MHSCDYSDSALEAAESRSDFDPKGDTSQAEFTITELAKDFGITLRALRFYESRGLLSPARDGRKRLFSRADRDRIALILKGKALGLTLAEISQMVAAESGAAAKKDLPMSRDKCEEQIAFFERQIREANEALTELRRIR